MDMDGPIDRKVREPQASDYFDQFDDDTITDAQKQEFLEALFHIMKGFVEMGFGMEPVSNLLDQFENSAAESSTMICSSSKTEKGDHE